MFNALTLYFTEDDEWQPTVCPIQMPDGTAKDLNTWAPFLVGLQVYDQFRAYPVALRTLIARCMADAAEDRPSLDELVNIISENIEESNAKGNEVSYAWREWLREDPTRERPPDDVTGPPDIEDNELYVRFFREYFREPPVRQSPYTDLWDADD
ncbi:hypothetical protein F5Y05DRAFT_394210 [Hypoxylon sp. FL0543]|nr:hypothetical protein F5Y05DRAFT_394210 [Hypoxylon sp. FL0543]